MGLNMKIGMHWIGHPGSLGWIVDRGEESVEDEVVTSESRSMGGGVRLAVSRDRPNRSWSFSIPESHSDEVSHIRTLLTATLPPYQLVTSDAQVSNVLTPERSTMQSLITPSAGLGMAGGWPKADGSWTTITRTNPAAAGGVQAVVRVGPAPIPPVWTGRKVTVSVWLAAARAAGAYVVLDWLDAAGVQLGGGVVGNSVTGLDALRRSTVTGTPPWGAVACRIGIVYAEMIGEPQVTWTDAPTPEWSIGEGADRIHIAASSRSTEWTVADSYERRRKDYSFTLREVGPR